MSRPQKKMKCNKIHFETRSKLQTEFSITGLYDCNNTPLVIGDIVQLNHCDYYVGLLQYYPSLKCYGIFFGKWYGDNLLSIESYGKFLKINSDNGQKMDLKKMGHIGNNTLTKYGDIL